MKSMRWCAAIGLLIAFGVSLVPTAAWGQATAPQVRSETFTNPVIRSGADPWVIRRDGMYYYCRSWDGSLWVAGSERLSGFGKAPRARVWTPPNGTVYSEDLWAPELHYLWGKWYIYVAADDGENHNHRMYVLEGTTQDPRDPFVLLGRVAAATDRWAIDATVLEMPDERKYLVWSGWEGFENVAQNLYIAELSDPLTIRGDRVCLSRPEWPWELNGEPLINEGPEALWHEGKLYLIYSASGSWTDDYCLGQLTWTGGEVLNPSSWVKRAEAVFARTDRVFGPGHCSFARSRDGREDWIIYHAAKSSGAGWDRNVRMQPFSWDAVGPRFGAPIPTGVALPLPSGD